MTEAQLDKKFDKAMSKVRKVYHRIYGDTVSILDDMIHDTMVCQISGMHEEYEDILYDLRKGIVVNEDAMDAINETVKYAKAVAKAMDACNRIPSPIFG